MTQKKQRKTNDYIDKEKFSLSVADYVESVRLAKISNKTIPRIPNDIAEGIMLICENLSHLRNFINYTYRDDMVMDAVENCLRAIHSFDPNAYTKSGKPNAFAYFTRTAWFAMVRRIQRENKEVKIKDEILNKSLPLDFLAGDDEMVSNYIENAIGFNMKDDYYD